MYKPCAFIDEIFGSPYGDPEEALIQASTPDPVPVSGWPVDWPVMQSVLSVLGEKDRAIIFMWSQGAGQHEISERVGLVQSSVCHKIQVITAWLRRVLPYRAALADDERIPATWTLETKTFYVGLVHRHQPSRVISKRHKYMFPHLVGELREHGTNAQVAVADFLSLRQKQWTRPATRTVV